MAEFPTFKGSLPWLRPWIASYCIPSCISHRPLPTYQISLKSKKCETYFIRSTRRSRPNKWSKNVHKRPHHRLVPARGCKLIRPIFSPSNIPFLASASVSSDLMALYKCYFIIIIILLLLYPHESVPKTASDQFTCGNNSLSAGYIGGGAYEAWRLLPPQNLWPGSMLWSIAPHKFCCQILLDPK